MGVVVAAVLAVSLSGCVRLEQHSPTEPGIPEARAAARAQLDEISAELTLSDRFVVLGAGDIDQCDAVRQWWFDNDRDHGFHCWMTALTVAVIPTAVTRADVALVVDDEMTSLDVPYYAGSMMRDLSPLDSDDLSAASFAMHGGGFDGTAAFTVSAEPFQAEFWPQPQPQPSTGDVESSTVDDGYGVVSASGDPYDVTVADIEATGASEVIMIAVDVEYWNTEGIPDVQAESSLTPTNVSSRYTTAGFGFELADWAPSTAPDRCLTDPSIDQSAVVTVDAPYPLLRLSLLPEAQWSDSDRVLECLRGGLSRGGLSRLSPAE